MLKKVFNNSLPLIVYNPAGVFDAEYFSACAEAEALPVYDTEFFSDEKVLGHIDILAETGFCFGIRVSASRENILNTLNMISIPGCCGIVIYYDNIDELKRYRPGNPSCPVIIEVTDIGINDLLDSINPAALILKGFEAPGKISRHTSFVLLQWYAGKSRFPFFIHGGVGYYTAAGMFAAGASGIVLDNQLYLAGESPVSEEIRSVISKLEESDSLVLTDSNGTRRRFFSKLATRTVRELKKKTDSGFYENGSGSLYDEVEKLYTPVDRINDDPMQRLFYLGQDAIFAKYFIKSSKNLREVIQNFFQHISSELSLIDIHDPIVEGSLLASDHGTRFPIVQGPMANVSDNVEFAQKIYEGGALPFFAVGSLPAALADRMLSGGKDKIPQYGAGLIGVPAFNSHLPEHMEIVKKHRSPFALFAAGNPSQIKELEASGIKAYLHTPSLSMLNNAISAGCRRFIFEGTEAGGHVGSLSSLVLWELALEQVSSLPENQVKDMRLLFAGGIGTLHASHFISGMTSSSAMRGCGIGVQVSTSYLFTREIVETGALSKVYQQVMCREQETIIIGDTVGLHARTVASPFSRRIHENEMHRAADNIPLNERKELFEKDNTGSLLIGAKAFHLEYNVNGEAGQISVSEDEQYEKGNFMAGDILSCEEKQITIQDVHERIVKQKGLMYRNLNNLEIVFGTDSTIHDEIAIIGMGCIYPDAGDPGKFWQNIISKRYSITEMPEERLKPIYYDKDKKAEDKSYTRLAGIIKDFRFDNKKYGYSDTEAAAISRSQGMILEAAIQAVEDAGYLNEGKPLPRDKTAVIIASCLTNELNSDLQLKYYYPEILHYLGEIEEFKTLDENEKNILRQCLKEGLALGHSNDNPDGASISTESSRIASHLGVNGINYTIDAACASSLAALDAGRKELLSGLHDVAVIGGLNTNLSPEAFVGFCKMGALSADGSFPFDERANGFILGEGSGVVVIKRMKDAIRDNDRIYAVIKGIGSSSDGKGKAIAAPNPEGQQYALERCYSSMYSGISMADVDYIEAHGTSTLMGDLAEIETLKKMYGASASRTGLSSVKSQIGHLLGGAGLAGIIKAVQAVRHRTLPPNGLFENLSPRFDLKNSGLYIIKETAPWQTENGRSRFAAVSSFGFGGINYHCVIGEFDSSYTAVERSGLFKPGSDSNARRIVVAGTGVVLPGAGNTDEYLRVLESGGALPRAIPATRFHNDKYAAENDGNYHLPELEAGIIDDSLIDTKKFRMPPATLRSVDRTQFIGLECSRQALEQSCLKENLRKGNKTAVVIGTISGEKVLDNIIRTRIPLIKEIITGSKASDSNRQNTIAEKLSKSLKERFHINNEDTVPGLLSNVASGRIANFFGCNGANYIIDAGTSSSAVAMRLACLGLRSGDYENAVTGGIDSNLTPASMRAFRLGQISSSEKTVNDVIPGEGGALFILTTYKNAADNGMPVLADMDSIVPDKCTGSHFQTMNALNESLNTCSQSNMLTGQPGFSYISEAVSPGKSSPSLYIAGKPDKGFRNRKSKPLFYRNADTAVLLSEFVLIDDKNRIHLNENHKPENHIDTVHHDPGNTLQQEHTGSGYTALLSGQGAQHPGMMKELYSSNELIRNIMNRGEEIFRSTRGHSLLDLMFSDNELINSTENTQPAVFLSTAAIFSVFSSDGFKPDYFVGHSLGECSALYCSGMLGFDETMKLVLERSALMKNAAENSAGEIMAVFTSWENAASLINGSGLTEIYIANKNSETQTVVAGSKNGVSGFCEILKKKNIVYKKLTLSGAFHTPLLLAASDGLHRYLDGINFLDADYSRVISNVTGKPYPQDEKTVKDLLAKQVISPVEFIESVYFVCSKGAASFAEIGTGGILTNLLKNIKTDIKSSITTVDRKRGETVSFDEARRLLKTVTSSFKETEMAENNDSALPSYREKTSIPFSLNMEGSISNDDGFKDFLKERKDDVERILHDEYRKYSMIREFEKFDFYTGQMVISGVSIGLPGKSRNVFEDTNFECILRGENRIELLTDEFLNAQLDKNITRVNKKSDGSAALQVIKTDDEVVQLAGQLGYFNKLDYGIEFDNDKADALAMAAGLEALRDAGIPLVPQYRKTSAGGYLFSGYALPEEMQDTTGVIRTSVFAGFDTIIDEVARYTTYRNINGPYKMFENIYYYIMEKVQDESVKRQVTEWFFNLRKQGAEGEYIFDRNFGLKLGYIGAPQFAQMIKAKGPNTQSNAACASLTQGIGMAEDWIRAGRCERVIVIGSEATDPERLGQWLHAGFLALGAATIKKNVFEAAKPFDAERNGTIIGSGAAAVIVERGDKVKKRGRAGQAEILGTVMGNSAFHGTRIDVDHVSDVMKKAVAKIEKRHGLNKDEYTKSLIFMSHETYTPAVGGSATAEVDAIKGSYPDHYKNIVITNTKGFTGHTLGGGLEDPVMIKALQLGIAPPIANLNNIPAEFRDLNFSKGTKGSYEYGIHFAAGFGSHFAVLFAKKIRELSTDNPVYLEWLRNISGYEKPELSLINKTLCIRVREDAVQNPLPAAAIPAAEKTVKPETPEKQHIPAVDPESNAVPVNRKNTVSTSFISNGIKEVIAEQTGYTTDMLDDNLDLEADLGIDTVKQVEIFGKISALFSLEVPEDLKLSDMNTIERLVSYISSKVGTGEPAAVSTSLPAASPAADISFISNGIKEVIAEQTGYTTDMLDDNLDLEADLGIDTVKQVEIFGKISALFSLEVPEDLKLSDMNTIERLVSYISSKVEDGKSRTSEADSFSLRGTSASDNSKGVINGDIHRFTISVCETGKLSNNLNDFNGKTFLISSDSHGFTDRISGRIRDNGGTVLTIGSNKTSDCVTDMTDPASVEKAVSAFSEKHGEINCFIHLNPADYILKSTDCTHQGIESSIKSFFVIIRTLNEKLRKKESIIASLSFNSVVFPHGEGCGQVYPVYAGISGMLKTINKEFTETTVKAVDFSTDNPLGNIDETADIFIKELLSGDPRVEVGYRNGIRHGIILRDESPEKGKSLVHDGSTILVTGGAGGITFEILSRFARDFRDLKLIILDRIDIDSVKKEFLAESVNEEYIISVLKKKMPGAKPLEIKNSAGMIMRAGKAVSNMERLRKLGARIEYHAVDINSADSVTKVLKKYRKIDGVIHAAGMEESQILEKMTSESFSRVFDVKVYGVLNLLSALSKTEYNFFAAFSSVAARFGNEGQVNYSGANEMLSKILFREKASHKNRVYKICDWTAWEGAGMATNTTVHKVLKDRGMSFLPLEQGIDLFMDELCDTKTVESVFTGIDKSFDKDGILPAGSVKEPGAENGLTIAPFLDKSLDISSGRMLFSRTLDLSHDFFINDHVKDGIPLFLGATGIETMAEAASELAGNGLFLHELRDFSIPYSIKILKGRPREIFIEAEKNTGYSSSIRCRITSRFTNPKGIPAGEPTLHYEGSYLFSAGEEQPVIDIPDANHVEIDGDFQQIIYHPERLFMDGLFRTVHGIHYFDGELLICKIKHAPEREFFAGSASPDFLVDVVLIDAMFQTGGIFEMLTTSDIILPSKIDRMIFHRTPAKDREYLCFTRKLSSGDEANTFSLLLADTEGRVYLEISMFEMVKITKVAKDSRIDHKFRIPELIHAQK